MATLLYRIGRASARHAWMFISAWVVILGLSLSAFLAFGGELTSQVTIPGTATEAVQNQLVDGFPAASGGSSSVVFSTADGSPFSDQQRSDVAAALTEVTGIYGVTGSIDPFAAQVRLTEQQAKLEASQQQILSGRVQLEQAQSQLQAASTQIDPQTFASQQSTIEQQLAELEQQAQRSADAATIVKLAQGVRQVSTDGATAIGTVQFGVPTAEVPRETKDAVIAQLGEAPIDGVRVEFSQSLSQQTPALFGVGEVVGLAIAAVALLVMLGTLIAAGLPLLNALIGVGAGMLLSLSLSGAVEMLSVTPVLGIMLGLAVGIDYSLFILNRHRSQLRKGIDLDESIGLANGTSGNAVVFAGTTVIIALLALNVTGIPFLGLMGTVGAICVAVAILVAVTLTPALLKLVGLRLLPKRTRAALGTPPKQTRPVKPMSTRRAVITLVGGLAVLLILAMPALSMRLGLPDASSEPVDSSAYKAYTQIDEAFGEGANGPLLVVAELPTAASEDEVVSLQAKVGLEISKVADVASVAPIGASDDRTLLAFQVRPEGGPTAPSTETLVGALRDTSIDGGMTLGVAGAASANIDISEKLANVLPLYLAVVVGLSLLILILVFRSILVPLTATAGFILSLLATFGGLTAVFQWGWLGAVSGVHDPGPVLSFLPILLVGILFGLAMDYQLFLVSGMREAFVHGASSRLAVQHGFHAGKTVVIAAAIIMISVFGGFLFSTSMIIQSLGFGLAFGVLIDAFIVRLLLIPAAMHLLGDAAWWLPKWLDRILPDVDVEGAALVGRSEAVAPAERSPQTIS